MELLKWELRKIWRPGILVVIVLLGVMHWWMRSSFFVEYFNNGSPVYETRFDLASDWVERYGPTIEQDEREKVEQQLTEAIAEFDRLIPTVPGMAEAGITDYESFRSLEAPSPEDDPEGYHAVYDLQKRVTMSTNYYTVQELHDFLWNYNILAGNTGESGLIQDERSDAEEWSDARLQKLQSGPAARGFLPYHVVYSANGYAKALAIWCALSVIVLLSPTLVRDRLHNTHPMQWTSRKGRRVVNVQIGAALLSAFLLTLLNFAVYALPFLSTGALVFRPCWLGSAWGYLIPWFDWTFGQYLLVLAGLILALTLGTAALTVFLSRYSGHYVAMLLKALPLFVAVGWAFSEWLVNGAGLSDNGASRLLRMPGAEFICAGVLLALGLGLCWATCRRQR